MPEEQPQKAEQIELDPEDDEILDEVWDKIAAEDEANPPAEDDDTEA
jgi:hypothetical protein